MLRHCLREPIAEIAVAAHQVDHAVSAHFRGERGLAEDLLRQADSRVLWDWLDSVWGKETIYNRRRRLLADPPVLPKVSQRQFSLILL